MGRCRFCGNEGWMVWTTREGLCKPCNASVRAEIATRTESVKDALVYIRCTKDPGSLLPLCDEAIEHARELVSFEKRGITDIRPVPSSLLAMLQAKRDEVVAELRAADDARARRTAAPAEKPGPLQLPGTPPPAAAESPASPAPDAWWAWNLEEGGADPAAEDEATAPGAGKRPLRERLHCLVLLDPGGIRATLENISLGGLFLSTPRVRPPGSRVRVILNTPAGPLQAEGVVRWARGNVEASPDPLGMGIEFTSSPPDLKAYLSSRFPSLQLSGSGLS